jgi:hypothetical protein
LFPGALDFALSLFWLLIPFLGGVFLHVGLFLVLEYARILFFAAVLVLNVIRMFFLVLFFFRFFFFFILFQASPRFV